MLDPIGSFHRIRELYLSYLDTAFGLGDTDLAERRRQLLCMPGSLCMEPANRANPALSLRRAPRGGSDKRGGCGAALARVQRRGAKAMAHLAVSGLLATDEDAESQFGRRSRFELYSHQRDMLARGVRPGNPRPS